MTPDSTSRQSERRKVLRRTGYELAAIEQFNHPGPGTPGRHRAGWRTYAPRSAACATRPTQTTRRPRASLRTNGSPAAISTRVGLRFVCAVPGCVGTTFQRRHRPQPELGEHPRDDRRCRFCRPVSGDLPFRRERDSRARAAVARSLPDEQHGRVGSLAEILGEPLTEERRAPPRTG